jgi:UDP-N-acetylmuramyl pentapeptide synthase
VNVNLEAPELTAQALHRDLRPGDLLLVKASRSVAAERILQALRALREN